MTTVTFLALIIVVLIVAVIYLVAKLRNANKALKETKKELDSIQESLAGMMAKKIQLTPPVLQTAPALEAFQEVSEPPSSSDDEMSDCDRKAMACVCGGQH